LNEFQELFLCFVEGFEKLVYKSRYPGIEGERAATFPEQGIGFSAYGRIIFQGSILGGMKTNIIIFNGHRPLTRMQAFYILQDV
jgi:hypothetical protein